MESERKVWQDKNADNIKRLLKENHAQQLWNGIRRLKEVKKKTKEVEPKKEREYFKGLLGTGSSEWRLPSENNVPRPEKRWEEELDRETELGKIHSYLKKAKNGKAVGVDGYPIEFWKELCKRENTSSMLVKIMNKYMKQVSSHQAGRRG
jgi:hypothetical protein